VAEMLKVSCGKPSCISVLVRFQVLTVVVIALMMEAVRTFEKSVYSSGTTRRYIPEGSNLYLDGCSRSFGSRISYIVMSFSINIGARNMESSELK
jgi:hypothetical protein